MSEGAEFLRIPRARGLMRPLTERQRDFRHVLRDSDPDIMREQASRCMGCGVPFCQSDYGCPLANFIPDWNSLMRSGRIREAVHILHQTNNFPEFTGLVCPAPCEKACVLSLVDEPVTIRSIELALAETGFAQGWIIPEPAFERSGRCIAVVGSGPAGLAAAQQLARRGHDVHVFEADDQPGGLLRYGIPDFKLEKRLIDRRIDQMRREGVVFHLRHRLGETMTLDQLRRDFDAVGLAVGASGPRRLSFDTNGTLGIVLAMDYLVHQNRIIAGADRVPEFDACGREVVIIGSGDTGADCLATAVRQGAKSIVQFELMNEPPAVDGAGWWPVWPMRLSGGAYAGAPDSRHYSVTVSGIRSRDGWVEAVEAVRVRHDGGGFSAVADSSFVVGAGMVIVAAGFTGLSEGAAGSLPGILDAGRRLVATSGPYMTAMDGVFAAGDCRRGASLVVTAIREGRDMAEQIDAWLHRQPRAARHPPS